MRGCSTNSCGGTVGQKKCRIESLNTSALICHNLSMCGRYRLSRRKQIIEEHFETADWQDDWNPRFNIAPTQRVPVDPAAPEGTSTAISR